MMLAALCIFAFLAGFVEAVVGGGGLIQLPAMFLLMPELSLLQTLATNKTANFLGTAVSAVQYKKKTNVSIKFLMPAIIAAFISSFCGAYLVSYIHKEDFIPILIIALTIILLYTLFKKELGKVSKTRQLSKPVYYIYTISIGAIIGLYDGLIGPGTGSFLVFGFILLFGFNFLQASAHAKLINVVTNIAAISFFLIRGAVVWSVALPIAASNMLGNYIGSHMAIKRGSTFVRVFFIIVVTALIAKLSYDYFLQGT